MRLISDLNVFIIMSLNSILLLIFLFIINLNYSSSLWKNSKDTLENYVIDILFTNSLTIIRCNPYERHILRDITFETIGYLKCSNINLFLPNNHIESITLLHWDNTSIKCNKKHIITSEKTYLDVKHKPKNAFKKLPLELIRVGSTGHSKLHWKDNKLNFEHPSRNSPINNTTQKEEVFSTEIYTFKNRPILCRERQPALQNPCITSNPPQNFSYVCYYKVNYVDNFVYLYIFFSIRKIGATDPPTIAEMENELQTLPNDINPDENSIVDHYIDKTPKEKSSIKIRFISRIFGIVIIIIIIIGIGICCSCCRSEKDDQNEEITRINSNTSTSSNISQD
jgi:hypothetical protein